MKSLYKSLCLIFACFVYINAFSAGAPVLSTLTTNTVTASSANFSFVVNANNGSTTLTVQLSTVNTEAGFTNGAQISNGSVSGTTTFTRTGTFTGLTAGTVYYWRVVAANFYGTTIPYAANFTTLPGMPAISNELYTNYTVNSVRINYTLNGAGANTTSIVRYGLAANNLTGQVTGGSATGNTNTNVYADLTGLTPSSIYYYQIEATNSAGVTTSTGNTISTLGPPVIANPTASVITYNTATINYDMRNTVNGSITSTINYGLSPSALTNSVAGATMGSSTFDNVSGVITGLQNNTTYYYTISSTNTYGTTTSTVNSFTTRAAELPLTSNFVPTNITSTSAKVNFLLTAKGATTSSVLKYGLASNALTSQVAGITSLNENGFYTNIVVNGLTAGTTYYYVIETTNSVGTTTSSVKTFSTVSSSATANAAGLIAYFGFENTLSNNDAAHSFTNGTATNVTFGAGKYGQAAYFTGASTLVNSSIDAVFNSSAFTISFWEYRPSVSGLYSTAIELFASCYIRAAVGGYDDGYFNYGLATNSATFKSDYGSLHSYYNNEWHHITLLRDASTGKYLNYYSDGVLIASITPAQAANTFFKFNNKITLGGGTLANGNLATNKYFTGRIDELYIYNKALTDAEILRLRDNATAVLPVKLTSFTATLQNGVTQLNWATSEEINASHFEIEYSNNGKDFTSVEVVNAIGASGASQSYQAFHKVNATPNHYYRLKIVDKDGKYAYSAIVAVNGNGANTLNIVLQNTVVKNQLQFAVTSNKATTVNIAVTNSVGQTILQPNKKPISAGSNSFSYIINNLSSGVYFLEMVDDSGAKQVVKFLK